jgi:transmembrane sensor
MTDERAERPERDAEWEEVARFLAGESDPGEQRRFRERLAREPERAALVAALDAALTRPPEPPLSAADVDAALAAVRARRDASPSGANRPSDPRVVPIARGAARRDRPAVWRRPAVRAAAGVLLLVGATLVWRGAASIERPTAGARPGAGATFTTGVGRVDTVALADGSRAILGPATSLTVGAGYGDRAREVTLHGLAFLDVVHDAARPFLVHTASATLRDVGTSFIVRSDSAAGTRVSVTTGAVHVAMTGAPTSSTAVLYAGDRAEVTVENMRVQRGAAAADELAWTRGVLAFRDAPLTTVAAELRRWYGLELVVDDATIAGRTVTATFERADADEVGRVLAAVLGATATRSGDTLRLGAPAAGQ